jgi:hypothetical protein
METDHIQAAIDFCHYPFTDDLKAKATAELAALKSEIEHAWDKYNDAMELNNQLQIIIQTREKLIASLESQLRDAEERIKTEGERGYDLCWSYHSHLTPKDDYTPYAEALAAQETITEISRTADGKVVTHTPTAAQEQEEK